MFTFVIAVNKVSKETTKNIEILLATKPQEDVIIIVNYSNYNIGYRDIKDIDYRHIKQSRRQAINASLPKDNDVVILESGIIISDNFVDNLYKYYDTNSLCSLRIDKSTRNGKFIESDYRIGSTITPKSFSYFAMAFNTTSIPRIGETAEETAIIATNCGISLTLLSNVRTVIPSIKDRTRDVVGITILIPSLEYGFIDSIKDHLCSSDRLYEFDSNPRGVSKFINKTMSDSPNDCVVIVNPNSKMHPDKMLNRIRGLFSPGTCILFDNGDGITDNAWLVVSKSKYTFSHKFFDTISQLHSHIISYNKDFISYIENNKPSPVFEKVKYQDMISIIIPYMYNGDRWPLFEACIERLYNCIKSHHNIEIIVHECGIKRYISPDFIGLYNIEYIFSEYSGVFHRAWCLNVAAKFVARGETFVFFDGDLLIDDKWVNELVSCNKSKSYVGWGEMKNLTKDGTDRYIKTKIISGALERSRVPDSYGPAGGINVIPKEIFFNIGGWPESYKDMGYGGEDNSLAFKMDKLGVYGVGMKKSIFTSPVYHLFHGHETVRDKNRHSIFNEHFKYDTEDWYEHIRKNYDWGHPIDGTIDISRYKPYIDKSLLYVYKNSKKPRITICMVNFLRYDVLIKSLERLQSFNIPINIILWVNQSDSMSDDIRKNIDSILNKFHSHEILYSKKNMGTGYPRYMMFNKAKFEYNTDYIMTTDDDIFHKNVDSLVLGSTFLDQHRYRHYGAVGIWCYPYYKIVKNNGNILVSSDTTEGLHDVDCLGAATMTFRKEILNTCNCDPQYIIGLVDWDFSMSIGSEGWKLGLICDPQYKPINDTSSNNDEYKNGRWDNKTIEKSKNIFKNKWNIKIK
jgi:hypothetical protein